MEQIGSNLPFNGKETDNSLREGLPQVSPTAACQGYN
jgi:hypothetical protein